MLLSVITYKNTTKHRPISNFL